MSIDWSKLENPTVVMKVTTTFGQSNIQREIEVEVLTVNFNSGGMRIRYIPDDYFGNNKKKYTADVSNQAFLDKYWKEN